MDDSPHEIAPSTNRRAYRSPKHALIWSFRRSRDRWKKKYNECKTRLATLQKDLMELPRLNAEFALMKAELLELHAENQQLRSRLAGKD